MPFNFTIISTSFSNCLLFFQYFLSAALNSVFVVKTTFLPAIRWQYIFKLEEGKVFYIGPLFFSKEALGPSVRWDLRFAPTLRCEKEDKDFSIRIFHHKDPRLNNIEH